MNWEASARDAEGKHCSTGISSQNRPAMSPSSALATLEFERSLDFRQLYPLSQIEALVSRAFLAGFVAKRARRGHERRSPLAREMVSRDLCHRRPPRPPAPRRSRAAGLPSTSPTAPAISESAPLDARPRRTGLAVDSQSSSSCLAPSEVVEPGGSLEDERARDAKKAPNELIWLRMVVRRTLRSTRGAGQIGE